MCRRLWQGRPAVSSVFPAGSLGSGSRGCAVGSGSPSGDEPDPTFFVSASGRACAVRCRRSRWGTRWGTWFLPSGAAGRGAIAESGRPRRTRAMSRQTATRLRFSQPRLPLIRGVTAGRHRDTAHPAHPRPASPATTPRQRAGPVPYPTGAPSLRPTGQVRDDAVPGRSIPRAPSQPPPANANMMTSPGAGATHTTISAASCDRPPITVPAPGGRRWTVWPIPRWPIFLARA